MSLFNRVKNIIKSNIEFGKNIDMENLEDIDVDKIFYDDRTEIPETNNNNIEQKYYSILGVEYGASFNKIKSAYRMLLKKYHPDLYLDDEKKLQTAKKLTQKINEAYTYFERKYK